MKIPYYQIDAFASEVFSGNPAGVCILNKWLPDDVLQNIAAENNLSETAFIINQGSYYDLRWFTPTAEVDLCGHATLAPSYLILNYLEPKSDSVNYSTISGKLTATRRKNLIEINFPSRPPVKCDIIPELVEALGETPVGVYKSRDYLVLYESENIISRITPDMVKLTKLECLGVIITAKSQKYDFVSRFFAPKVGVPEDPVTGSAHSTLIPFWADKLGKKQMLAKQISSRGGEVSCTLVGDRVLMAGNCVIYSQGEIFL